MSQKYWYQDGWQVLFILFFGGFFGLSFYVNSLEGSKPQIAPLFSGKLIQPFFGDPTLEVTVWHQHPDVLRNVQLHVNVNEDPKRGEEYWVRQQHSFESWLPNREQAVSLSFPLKHYDPEQEIEVVVILVGKSIKLSITSATWLGSSWKSDQK